MINALLTLKSSNAKVGPIPVSLTSNDSCPTYCGMREGCYAMSGPVSMHWRAVSNGVRGVDWDSFCEQVSALPEEQIWRHNQAGDLPQRDGLIDRDKLAALVEANAGRRGFTYTHHDPLRGENAEAIAMANGLGFTVNLSADHLGQVDALADLGIGPVVVALPMDVTENLKTPAGRTVVVCPATQREDVTCSSCQLCQRQRESVVGFPAHGPSERKADAVARGFIPIVPAM